MTHRVQIVNKPDDIIELKVRHTLEIFLPIESAAELVVKVGRVLVEAIESLQGRGTGRRHEDCPRVRR